MFRLWSIWQISVIWIWIVILILGALLVNVVTLGFIARPFLCPWLRFYGRSILKLCRIEWEVEGMGHFSDDGPAIVVFNHTSLLDMFLLTAIAPARVTYVLKRELLFYPFIGLFIWLFGFVSIDRGRSERARRTMEKATERVKLEGLWITMAPEGKRTRDGKVGRFKLGAFRMAVATKAPIIPVAIAGAYGLHPYGQWCTKPGKVAIRIMNPEPSTEWDDTQLEEFARAVEKRIADEVESLHDEHPEISRS